MAEPSFFVRTVYLSQVKQESLKEGACFNQEESEDLINAGLAFAAERKALDYLGRCEQFRAGLMNKLLAKGFDKVYINLALDYLEKKEFLSDARFARSFLNMRKINHAEGRIRLEQELLGRGISKETAKNALDEFFEENSEEEICKRAIQKCIKLKKSEEKANAYLLRCGFPYKLIQNVRAELNGKED